MSQLIFSKVVTIPHGETKTVRICPWDHTRTNLPPEAVGVNLAFSVRTDGLQSVTARLHEFGLGTGKPIDPDVLRSADRITPEDSVVLVDSNTSGLDLNQSVVLVETIPTFLGASGTVNGDWLLPIDGTNTREWVVAVSNDGLAFPTPAQVEITFGIRPLFPKK